MKITSRWNDPHIRAQAQYLRRRGNKGVRLAVAVAKRFEAENRNLLTLPEHRRCARRAAGVTR